jgi:excisionase family DNA binding protein
VIDRLACTPAEIATAAGLSRKTIYRAIANGELRASRVCGGSRLLIPALAARDWLEENVVRPEPSMLPSHSRVQDQRRPGQPLRDAMASLGGRATAVYDERMTREGASP